MLAKWLGARGLLDLCAGQYVALEAATTGAGPGLWVLTDVVN
jgi:hypothetical protein